MKVIFVLLVIFIILIALMLLDMLLGRAAYKKQAYEPVFDPKKVISHSFTAAASLCSR